MKVVQYYLGNRV